MIPRLYAAGTTVFTNEGLGALSDCISCEAYTAINGVPELNITYPVNGRHAAEIGERCIIIADRDATIKAQPYIVKTITKAIPGIMEIYAIHLAVDLADSVGLKPFSSWTLYHAIAAIPNNTTSPLGITIGTTKTSNTSFTNAIPKTVKMAMGGSSGSLLDTYGGEWDFFNLTATLKDRVGADNGVEVRYGKNLVSLSVETDWSGVYTGIYPYWVNGQTKAVTQMTPPIYSLGTFDFTRILTLDVSSSFQSAPSDADLLAAAQAYAGSHNLTSPKISWDVKMKELRKSPEYKDLGILETVSLGDSINIYLERFDIDATARIVTERYDVLREQYTELQIGSVRSSFTGSVAAQEKEIENVQSDMTDAIQRATDLITGNTGGYVVTRLNAAGEPEELLIMDDPDINQATKVWRWNVNGLGYSSTGYQGPYTTAITQNGEIVADFIKTGTLDAAQINVINLIAQHVRATDGAKVMDIVSSQLTVNNGANWRVWLRSDEFNQGALIVYSGTRPNLNGNPDDAGNDSTSKMSYIDPSNVAVGVNKDNVATGTVVAHSLFLKNNAFIYLYDTSNKLRVWIDGSDGSIVNRDANNIERWALRDSGNIQTYDSAGKERASLYPAEGQLALYNASGTRTVQIRGDGTASSTPLPVNQGGTGSTGTESITASVSSTVGSITVTDCRRWGRVAMVTLDCVNTSAITAMNYLARGTLSGSNVPLPKRITTAVQFTGAHLSVCSLDTDGTITSRVMVGTLPANSSRRFVFTYLLW